MGFFVSLKTEDFWVTFSLQPLQMNYCTFFTFNASIKIDEEKKIRILSKNNVKYNWKKLKKAFAVNRKKNCSKRFAPKWWNCLEKWFFSSSLKTDNILAFFSLQTSEMTKALFLFNNFFKIDEEKEIRMLSKNNIKSNWRL